MSSFSIIIPTLGRDSLGHLLRQLILQLGSTDEVIVVSDGPMRCSSDSFGIFDTRVKFHEGERTNRWGNEQRNIGISLAKGDFLLFLDDDDEVLPSYLLMIRQAVKHCPERVTLFRMKHGPMTLWMTREVTQGNVSTQMFVVPNIPGRLGRWSDRYEGDFDFLKSTLELYPESERDVSWREEVITIHGHAPDKGLFVKWPSLSLIIPTIGRPLLKRLLSQVVPQLWQDDEVMVVGDGPQPAAEIMVAGLDPRVTYYEYGPTRCWGHQQRNWAMLVAGKSHLMFLDDDDQTVQGAFNVIREVAARNPEKLLIFKTVHQGSPIWKTPEIKQLNVSTQCFVVPNIPERLGTWGSRYQGDLDFIESAVKAHPEGPGGVIFRPEITSIHGEPDRA